MSFPILIASTMSALHIRHDVPAWLAKGVHSHMTLNTHPVTCEWKPVEDNSLVPRIMDRYFGVDVLRGKMCDLFLIEGVPAASIVYDTRGGEHPFVEEFHANKEMMLLFDAGPCMRKGLYERYGPIDLKYTKNKDDLLLL